MNGAKEKLLELMQCRNWHGIKGNDKELRAAGWDKTLHTRGQLSYEKCCKWLTKLGYQMTKKEVWTKK